jgi:hypothetical protein
MTENDTSILIDFKKQFISFLDELSTQFPQEGNFVILRLSLSCEIFPKIIMDNFIHMINKNNQELKKLITQRNESFFIDFDIFDIFENFKKTEENIFKKIFINKQLDKEDKSILWKWIDLFVLISEKYSKYKKL